MSAFKYAARVSARGKGHIKGSAAKAVKQAKANNVITNGTNRAVIAAEK
jgi:hypothetical protein